MAFYSTAELMDIAIPPWLIYKILPGYGIALLYGPPECGKSFVAVDWALCVATGTPWRKHPVQQGHVVYIASEGGEGLKKRVAAWLDVHDITAAPDIQWFLDTLDFRNQEEIDAFMLDLQARYPEHDEYEHSVRSRVTYGGLDLRLIVVDTLAQNFNGEDENSFQSMQPFMTALTAFSKEKGATILLVHHTNAVGSRERGHSSLRGHISASFDVRAIRDEHTNQLTEVRVLNDKQKDDPRQGLLRFQPRVYPLPMLDPDEHGHIHTTLVLEPALSEAERIRRTVVAFVTNAEGPSQSDILDALSDFPERHVRQILDEMVSEGVIRRQRGAHGRHIYGASTTKTPKG